MPSLAACLDGLGYDAAAFHDLVPTMAAEALASGSPNNNPIVPTQGDIEDVYRAIYADGA